MKRRRFRDRVGDGLVLICLIALGFLAVLSAVLDPKKKPEETKQSQPIIVIVPAPYMVPVYPAPTPRLDRT